MSGTIHAVRFHRDNMQISRQDLHGNTLANSAYIYVAVIHTGYSFKLCLHVAVIYTGNTRADIRIHFTLSFNTLYR